MTEGNMDRERGMAEIAIEPEKARDFGMSVLSQLDVPLEKGKICIEAFLFGSLRGIDSHGFFALLPRLVREIRAGMIDPKADVRIIKGKTSTLLIDGCSGPGPVTALQSMKEAMRLCRENGIGGGVHLQLLPFRCRLVLWISGRQGGSDRINFRQCHTQSRATRGT